MNTKKRGRPPVMGERKESITVRALVRDHERIRDIAKGVLGSAPIVKPSGVVELSEYGSMTNPFDAEVLALREENGRLRAKVLEYEVMLNGS